MSGADKLEFEGMPDAQARRMFPDKPTEEIVREIAAADPERHGVSVEERKRRALEQAKAEAAALQSFYADEGVQDQGGQADPDRSGAAEAPQTEESPGGGPIIPESLSEPCGHAFPEDAEDETKCPLCGMTLKEWLQS